MTCVTDTLNSMIDHEFRVSQAAMSNTNFGYLPNFPFIRVDIPQRYPVSHRISLLTKLSPYWSSDLMYINMLRELKNEPLVTETVT